MYVLSRDEMKSIDKHTIENYQIPGRLLMELAGKGCFDKINSLIPIKANIALFCGVGNNGGDGFVLARWLKNYKHSPMVFIVGNVKKMSIETEINHYLLKKMNIPVIYIENINDWENVVKEHLRINKCRFDVIIDAIFGIGFKGQVPFLLSEIILKINELRGMKVAIDIPSGLDADNGFAEVVFRADYTLTMAAPKYGHFLGSGKDICGNMEIIDIGIPDTVYREVEPIISLAEENTFKLPSRYHTAHKGTYGKVAVIAGSTGYTGAAILACNAALRSGSGLIKLYHPAGLDYILESQLPEIITQSIPSLDNTKEINDFINELNSNDVLLIGPGIRISQQTIILMDAITKLWQKPAVFDADAINIISQNSMWISRLHNKPIILTPHIGEFSRLMGISKEQLFDSPLFYVNEFVSKYQCSLLLKSSYRLYCDNTRTVLDVSGNDGLATGGSGDVLSGLIVSFLGQNCTLPDAAVSASYLLGKTAERCCETFNKISITPSLIINNLFKL